MASSYTREAVSSTCNSLIYFLENPDSLDMPQVPVPPVPDRNTAHEIDAQNDVYQNLCNLVKAVVKKVSNDMPGFGDILDWQALDAIADISAPHEQGGQDGWGMKDRPANGNVPLAAIAIPLRPNANSGAAEGANTNASAALQRVLNGLRNVEAEVLQLYELQNGPSGARQQASSPTQQASVSSDIASPAAPTPQSTVRAPALGVQAPQQQQQGQQQGQQRFPGLNKAPGSAVSGMGNSVSAGAVAPPAPPSPTPSTSSIGSSNPSALFSSHDPPHSRLFVRCSRHLTYEQLGQMFAQYGTIQELKPVTERQTGQFRGIVFVKFAKASEAARAKEELNGRTIDGQMLFIQVAEPREGRLPVVPGGPGATGIGNAGGMPPAAAGGRYPAVDDADNPPHSRLFVTCPKDMTPEDLHLVFSKFGEIQHINILADKATGQPRGFAFVKFAKASSAALATEHLAMERATSGGQTLIQCRIADPRSPPRTGGPMMPGGDVRGGVPGGHMHMMAEQDEFYPYLNSW